MSRRSCRRPRPRSAVLPLLISLLLALGMVLGVPVRAAADVPATFSNTASIAVPGTGERGPANPYPSDLTVAGMSGAVTKVTVTLAGVTHGALADVDAMVVAPGGRNLVIVSDVGDTDLQLVTATNATLTFDDAAAGPVPAQVVVPTGTYRPTNENPGNAADTFPASAPSPSNQTTLAGAFTGIDPNGTWSLYVVDDGPGETGSLAGGWSISVTTETAAASTTTVVTSSDATSTTGQAVTFTATVSSDDGPVPAGGTVQFTDGGSNLGTPRPVDDSGVATLSVSTLAEGTHTIGATYSGITGYLTSNGSVSQRVDNATVVTDTTFCNPGAIVPPNRGQAVPYPSNVFVTGLSGEVTKVTAALRGVSHAEPQDLDILLSGPTPTRNVILLSDAGGQDAVSDLDLVFDDEADGAAPSPLTSGTFRPTDVDPEDQIDAFPTPAPTLSSATALSTFDGASANGTWSLWVVDDATGDAGSIADGWCLTITSQSPTTTVLTSDLDPSTFGEPVTLRATVTAGDDPVTAGTVQFSDGGTPLGDPVPVDGSGVATLTTSTLSVGTHPITATYSGTATLAASDGVLTQVVNKAVTTTALTSSTNPSDVGESVTFTATITSAGEPVSAGSVQFAVDGTDVGDAVAPDASGQVTYTSNALPAGTHVITAEFSGTTTLATSDDDLDQVVAKIVTETEISSSLNPSRVGDEVTFTATVTVAGAPLTTGSVQFADDGAALGAPQPLAADGTATYATADLAEGTHPITATLVTTPQYAGSTSDPVNQVVGLVPTTTALESSVNPSSVGQSVTFTATVTAEGGGTPAGFVQFRNGSNDLGTPVPLDAGGRATFTTSSLTAGPHVITAVFLATTQYATSTSNLVTQQVDTIETTTSVTSTPDPSDLGQSVTFTASVASAAGAVTTGTVTFSIDGGPPAPPVPVTAGGIAEFSVATLDPGEHTITATYSGDATYAASQGSDEHGVRPVADAGGPYAVAEGGSLTLQAGDGTTDGVTYAWDLDGDGAADATGANPTVSWAQLQDLGIDDGLTPAVPQTITLRVSLDDVGSAPDEGELTVTNTAPDSILTGSRAATVGEPFTIKVGADDPSTADLAALFTYTVDWGDGSPVETTVGPADPPVTHTYATAGVFAATFTATDKDGGTGPGLTVEITVRAQQTASPTSNPNPTTDDPDDGYDDPDDTDGGSLASTGSDVGLGSLAAGLALLGAGGALLVTARRRGGRREG